MRSIVYILASSVVQQALAQTTILPFLVVTQGAPLTTPASGLVGSILGVKDDLTTVLLDCASDVAKRECAMVPGVTITQGPSSWGYELAARLASESTPQYVGLEIAWFHYQPLWL